MALQLLTSPSSSSSASPLHLLAAYEDGRVAHFAFTGSTPKAFDSPTGPREEGEEWELVWEEKGHREAGESFPFELEKLELTPRVNSHVARSIVGQGDGMVMCCRSLHLPVLALRDISHRGVSPLVPEPPSPS